MTTKRATDRALTEEIKSEIKSVKEEILTALAKHDNSISSLEMRVYTLELHNKTQEDKIKTFWAKDWPGLLEDMKTLEVSNKEIVKTIYKATGAISALVVGAGILISLAKVFS